MNLTAAQVKDRVNGITQLKKEEFDKKIANYIANQLEGDVKQFENLIEHTIEKHPDTLSVSGWPSSICQLEPKDRARILVEHFVSKGFSAEYRSASTCINVGWY